MGRSVNYHSDNRAVIYLHEEEIYDFDDYIWQIVQGLKDLAPSFEETKREWHDREVIKIAENSLCTVWISEYCGLVSLSFVPIEESYHTGKNITGLAGHWIDTYVKAYKKRLGDRRLIKLGSFSNGEGVFAQVSEEPLSTLA